jgi:hypothetical protein
MERKTTRREFLKQSLSAGAGLLFLRSWGKGHSPNDKLNIAAIGVGGRGWDNLREVARENIVALCDVDLNHLANAAKVFPDARVVDGLSAHARSPERHRRGGHQHP